MGASFVHFHDIMDKKEILSITSNVFYVLDKYVYVYVYFEMYLPCIVNLFHAECVLIWMN